MTGIGWGGQGPLSLRAETGAGASPQEDSGQSEAGQDPMYSLPLDLFEVIRLTQAGASEQTLLDYVRHTPAAETLTAEQTAYLRQQGVTPAVLSALQERPVSGTSEQDSPEPLESSTNGEAASNGEVGTIPSPDPPPTQYTGGAGVVYDDGSFYNSLAPYGQWTQFPNYGWCWQPYIAGNTAGWQPYGNNGCWLWSNAGWYWHSGYRWGWGPFHYGRWWHHPRRGWYWQPGRRWGPSWVSWRASLGAGGWAPLPPGAGFEVGTGWTYEGRGMGRQYGFNLPSSAYTFVPFQRLTAPDVFNYRLSPALSQTHFYNSVLVENFRTGPDNSVINRGIDPRRVVMATHAPVPQTQLNSLYRAIAPLGGFSSAVPLEPNAPGVRTSLGSAWQRQLDNIANTSAFNTSPTYALAGYGYPGYSSAGYWYPDNRGGYYPPGLFARWHWPGNLAARHPHPGPKPAGWHWPNVALGNPFWNRPFYRNNYAMVNPWRRNQSWVGSTPYAYPRRFGPAVRPPRAQPSQTPNPTATMLPASPILPASPRLPPFHVLPPQTQRSAAPSPAPPHFIAPARGAGPSRGR